jgi:glutaredoxin
MTVVLGGLLLTGVSTPAYTENQSTSEIHSKNTLYFFWGAGCPHCAAAKPFLAELNKKYPTLIISSHEVYNSPENLAIMRKMAKSHGTEPTGVPTFFFGEKMYVGFSESIAEEITVAVSSVIGKGNDSESLADNRMKKNTPEEVTIPLLGKKDAQSLSLPLFTVIIAGLDSFNPCAFFVLFTLLSLLVHAHSRKRMLLIGGVFVFFSGCIYFLFMATWLNLYFIIGNLTAVTYIAGVLALIIALINIKDFFYLKKGLSLSISEASKPKLFERMRRLLRTESLPSVLTGSIVLAVTANSYELLCTAGFPMIYTRVLTLNALSAGKYYAYLALYNLIYVLPLAIIVVFFVATLGSKKLSEWQGRVLKLLSGLMMLSLALVLLIRPSLLQNALFSVELLLGVVSMTIIIATLTKKYFKSG